MIGSEPLKILIAEDNETDRMILERIIREQGYRTVMAKNGKEAIDQFLKEAPSIILMDALMPVVDGFEATQKIRFLAGDDFVPILFLTSLTDDLSLVSCLEAGGDDFISKPYRPVVLAAKIQAYRRMLVMHQTLRHQRDEIARSNEHMLQEQQIAKKVFDNVAHMGCLDAANIKHVLSPMSVFNGDVLIAARKPSGGLVVLLGDFTGHGLPAAIGAMPISEIFYGMAAKGFGIENILREINQKLKMILPVGFFCCASMIDISYAQQRIKLWNGGLPDVLLRQKDGSVKRFESEHLPLGILSVDKFKADCVQHEMRLDDRVYLFSDGIVDIRNEQGKLFGIGHIYTMLSQTGETETLFERLIESAIEYMGPEGHEDDLTLVEVTMEPEQSQFDGSVLAKSSAMPGARDWAFSFEFFNETVRDFNPIPLMLHVTMELPELNAFSSDLYTIFSELISNAVDHGLLGLDSALKTTPNGFQTYYQYRSERLRQLSEPSIQISLRHQPEAEGGLLTIEVKDSGPGFDIETIDGLMPGEGEYSGRGIPLLMTLCETVDYLGNGNTARVCYRWRPLPEDDKKEV